MSGKIEISRELAERIVGWYDGGYGGTIIDEVDELRAMIAAPVVERQEEKLDKPAMVGCTRFNKGVSSRLVIEAAQRNYEYQVTPEKEAERIAKGAVFLETLHNTLSPPAPVSIATYDDGFADGLSEASLNMPEPFAWHTEDHLTDKSATTFDKATAERWKAKGWPVHSLYNSPPAPVAVVLPNQRTIFDKDFDEEDRSYSTGWNACLDKVKELNS